METRAQLREILIKALERMDQETRAKLKREVDASMRRLEFKVIPGGLKTPEAHQPVVQLK